MGRAGSVTDAFIALLAGVASFALFASLACLAAMPARADEPRETLDVFAAASLSDGFAEIARLLEKTRPGLSVRFNFAGSQQLAAQIDQGAPADLFASADRRWMAYSEEHGLIADPPIEFARNALVVIVPSANPARIVRLQDLARRGVKLVVAAEAVPAGTYTRDVVRNLSRAPGFGAEFLRRVFANVVSEEENVKSVVAKIELGEADAGFVYRSDVAPSAARRVRMLEIPDSSNVVASYPIAIVKSASNADAARAFVALALSPEGQQILERHGFLPADDEPR